VIFFVFKHSLHSGFSFYDNGLSGNCIVFIHGLGANAQHADFLIRAFPTHRIILVELPGHGKAPAPKEPIDIALMAKELGLALQAKGIDKPILCGHSLGAQICLLMEIMIPGLAKKLLLLSPAGLEAFSEMEIQMILSGIQMTSLLQPIMAPRMQSEFIKENWQVLDSDTTHSYISSMLHRPVNELLHMIQCEAEVYFGENDLMIPNRLFRLESAVYFATRVLKDLPNFEVVSLPMTGHWPMMENPGVLIQALQKHNP
jgi:pimeloyl-ACP methyl ester carboxylesterase